MAIRRGRRIDRRRLNNFNRSIDHGTSILSVDYALVSFEGFVGVINSNKLDIKYELVSFEAESGAALAADVLFSFDAVGTRDETGALTADVLFGMAAEATYGETAELEVEYELLSFEALQGPVLAATVSFSFDAAATHSQPAILTANVLFGFAATANADVARGTLDINYVLVSTGTTGELALTYDLVSFGAAANTDGALSAPSETWAINLRTGGISRYSVGFTRFLRLGTTYYGLSHTGNLYQLGGANDNGGDINAVALTHESDFGEPILKNVPKLYVDGRAVDGLIVSAVVDEADLYRYKSTKLAANNLSDKPIKLARGVKGKRWGFEIRNIDGGAVTIHALEPLIRGRERRTI